MFYFNPNTDHSNICMIVPYFEPTVFHKDQCSFVHGLLSSRKRQENIL